MAAQAAAQSVVSAQQKYASSFELAHVFADLTTAVIYKKPTDLISFIQSEAQRMLREKDKYNPAPVDKVLDTEEAAAKYLADNHVHAVLEELFAMLLVAKPNSPLEYLVSECGKLHSLHSTHQPSQFFTDDDLKGMFLLFDASTNNYISIEQCKTAMRNLGMKDSTSVIEKHMSGITHGRVELPTFIAIARECLNKERIL